MSTLNIGFDLMLLLFLQALQPDPEEADHAEGAGQRSHFGGHRRQAAGTTATASGSKPRKCCGLLPNFSPGENSEGKKMAMSFVNLTNKVFLS